MRRESVRVMVTWNNFWIFAIMAVLLWAAGAYFAWRGITPTGMGGGKLSLLGEERTASGSQRQRKSIWPFIMTILGLGVFFSFIVGLWVSLERPPLRTMGETRLWYSLFLPTAGLIVYARWRYRWILTFSTILATVFVCINILKPEIHNKALMPALQSIWFAPHVIVYMFAYALLGAATLVAIYLLWIKRKPIVASEMELTDNLVYVGLAFMTLGLLMGAIWAKEAWGHYWAWDPKETWAAATWFAYLAYLHYRIQRPADWRNPLLALIVCFLLLQMCWWGINYLPAAKGSSVHTYNLS